MGLFEPSTWAEVEEAIISNKPSARPTDAFVLQLRSFTDAPEKYVTSDSSTCFTTDTNAESNSDLKPHEHQANGQQLMKAKGRRGVAMPGGVKACTEAQFDDLLGLGRVDLDAESYVRKYSSQTRQLEDELTTFPLVMTPTSNVQSKRYMNVLNPSSTYFNAVTYLHKLHIDSTKIQLLNGLNLLSSVENHLRTKISNDSQFHFIHALIVESALYDSKFNHQLYFPSTNHVVLNHLKIAHVNLKQKFQHVVKREKQVQKLKRSLSIYSKYKWLFQLQSKFQQIARDLLNSGNGVENNSEGRVIADIDEVLRDYHRANLWLRAQRMNQKDEEVPKQKLEEGNIQQQKQSVNNSCSINENENKHSKPPFHLIQRSIQGGYDTLKKAIIKRLSNSEGTEKELRSDTKQNNKSQNKKKKQHEQQTIRLIMMLLTNKQEDILKESLTQRSIYAQNLLDQSTIKSNDIPLILSSTSSSDINNNNDSNNKISMLINETTQHLIDGIHHIWELGRLILKLLSTSASIDRWVDMIDNVLICNLIKDYMKLIRANIQILSKSCIEQICHLYQSISEFPYIQCSIQMLKQIHSDVCTIYLQNLSTNLKIEIDNLILAYNYDCNNAKIIQDLTQIVQTCLDDIRVTLIIIEQEKELEEADQEEEQQQAYDKNNKQLSTASHYSQQTSHFSLLLQSTISNEEDEFGRNKKKTIISNKNSETVFSSCFEQIASFTERLKIRISEHPSSNKLKPGEERNKKWNYLLRLAANCDAIELEIIPLIIERHRRYEMPNEGQNEHMNKCLGLVKQMKQESIGEYLEKSCERIFKEALRISESSTTPNANETADEKKEIRLTQGIRKETKEILLQVLLICIDVKGYCTEHKQLMKSIIVTIIDKIGNCMLNGLSTNKLNYKKAAQLWLDTTILQNMFMFGIVQQQYDQTILNSLNAFMKVKERCTQAIITDGLSFNAADEKKLRGTVITDAMRDLHMVAMCFKEMWTFVFRRKKNIRNITKYPNV